MCSKGLVATPSSQEKGKALVNQILPPQTSNKNLTSQTNNSQPTNNIMGNTKVNEKAPNSTINSSFSPPLTNKTKDKTEGNVMK